MKYSELHVWRKSVELATDVYKTIQATFPLDEKYGLSSQIKRCSVSIASNIAEGASRDSSKEFVHFISIARGSLAEFLTQIEIAHNVKILHSGDYLRFQPMCEEIGKMLNGLKKSIK